MSGQKQNEPGMKYDAGKPAHELLDFETFRSLDPEPVANPVALYIEAWADRHPAGDLSRALELASSLLCSDNPIAAMRTEVARVLEFGANKYAAHNWRKGMSWSRLVGSALRHLEAYGRGEIADPETGYSHLGHLGCNLMFLITYQREGLGTDDRYKPPLKEINGQNVKTLALPEATC